MGMAEQVAARLVEPMQPGPAVVVTKRLLVETTEVA